MIHRKSTLLFVSSLMLLLVGCVRQGPKIYSPAAVDFQVSYKSYLEGQFYPSMVMALSGLNSQQDLSDTNALFMVTVTAPAAGSVLRITIDSSKLNYVTIIQEVLPVSGVRYTFYPQVKWKYDNLYRIRQQGIADLTFTCYINDEEVDVKNIRLNYRSANDCLLNVLDDQGQVHDYRWLFAAYVNEEHPYIDSILSGMLEQGVVKNISGYQKGGKYVVPQVEAIWNYALERGISYSSISCTSSPTKRSNVQHIRFFDEVYNTRQANCIDACVFFASIMRKIGLKPVIFVEPCHAYLGYYTDTKRTNLKLLETTITSWVDFPMLTRQFNEAKASNPAAADKDCIPASIAEEYTKYLSSEQKKQWESGQMSFNALKQAVSHNLFVRATEYDDENYKTNRKNFADPTNQQFQQLDIETMRKVVQPIH